jgi:hypothetical protein
VLAAVRTLNRLERVGETLRAALNAVAVVAPAWLRALADERRSGLPEHVNQACRLTARS